jgi:hypothetical protein
VSEGTQFIAFQGGLDQITQAMLVPRGRCIAANNYFSAIQGYQRHDGYERFDGQPSPTIAGLMLLDQGNADAARAARDAARALIQPVPGSGPVRGVLRMGDIQYAVRDNITGTAGVLHKATPAGWVAVNLGYAVDWTSGGTYVVKPGDTITGASSGATAIVRKVVMQSGGYTAGDAAGYFVLDTITGTFTANENLNVGANTNVATMTGIPAAQTLPAGGRYISRLWNFYGNPGARALYAVNGVGRAFEFDGTYLTFIRTQPSATVDKPHRIAQHGNRLMLGFPGASVQGSQAGVPTSFSGTAGAFEIGVGSEIADFLETINALVVICQRAIWSITGSTVLGSSPDISATILSSEEGGLPFTAQGSNQSVYFDGTGARLISATQSFGNFRIGVLAGAVSLGVQRFVTNKIKAGISPIASLFTAPLNLYRLIYADGTGLSIYFGRKNPEPMLFDLGGKVPTCICSDYDSDEVTRSFFGATDGYVYQMDTGTSFDGAKIDAFIKLPFDHCGSPRQIKKFDRAILETIPSPETKIGFVYEYDDGDSEQPAPPLTSLAILGGGGDWNTVDWDTFQWNAPINGKAYYDIDGQGTNLSTTWICSADDQRSNVLEGVTLLYRAKGQARGKVG